MALPIQITFMESSFLPWVEQTQTQDVSAVGARFTVSRAPEVGQLIHLCIRMPAQLRKYDQTAPNYQVWALVRFARPCKFVGGSGNHYEVGAAFVGKKPPESFLADPTIRYHLAPPEMKDGFWRLFLPGSGIEVIPG